MFEDELSLLLVRAVLSLCECFCYPLHRPGHSFESSLPWLRLTFFSPHLRWLKFEVCCICCSICLKNPQHDVHVPSTSTSQNHPKVPFKKNCDDFPTPNGTRRLNSVSQAMKTPPKYCCALLRSSLLKGVVFFTHDFMRIPSRTPSGNRGKLGNPSLLHGRFSHVIPYHYPL